MAVVLSLTLLRRSLPVYNIEVHGEHVYEVGVHILLVHNSAENCIGTYNELRKTIKETAEIGLQVHHLLEKRFKDILGLKSGNMTSVALKPDAHQAFTNAWRAEIPYGAGTANATDKSVLDTARKIYQNFPEFLNALGL